MTSTAHDDDRMGFRLWAEAEPDRLALIDAHGRELTYGALQEEANRITHGLRGLVGAGTGDTIASVLPNSVELVALYLAAMQAGLYLVTVNYHLTAGEIEYILRDSGACAVVTADRSADAVAAAAEGAGIGDRAFTTGVDPRLRPFTELVDGQSSALPADRTAGSIMQYTSGTTGRPKGVKRPLTGQDAEAGARVYRWLFDELGVHDSFERWLVAAPMYHSANLAPASGALHLGGSLVLMEGWTPELCLEAVSRHRVTGTHMVPTQLHRLMQLPAETRSRHDVSSIRYILHGAAPISVELKRRVMDWLGPILYEYYGSTEVGTTVARPHEWLERPGTVGRPSSISELAILDEAGNELGPGEVGLVYMRQGEDVMEYHNDPGRTASLRRGRLLTVRDLGWVDEDGFLFLAGRASDMIIVGGANVYPAEIEAILLADPGVADAGVVGRTDDDLGEVPVAFVQPRPGVDAAMLVDALRERCEEHLARNKRPVAYHLSPELPRDPNGKLYKARLADLLTTAPVGEE